MTQPHLGDMRPGENEVEMWNGERWTPLSEELERLKAIKPKPFPKETDQ